MSARQTKDSDEYIVDFASSTDDDDDEETDPVKLLQRQISALRRKISAQAKKPDASAAAAASERASGSGAPPGAKPPPPIARGGGQQQGGAASGGRGLAARRAAHAAEAMQSAAHADEAKALEDAREAAASFLSSLEPPPLVPLANAAPGTSAQPETSPPARGGAAAATKAAKNRMRLAATSGLASPNRRPQHGLPALRRTGAPSVHPPSLLYATSDLVTPASGNVVVHASGSAAPSSDPSLGKRRGDSFARSVVEKSVSLENTSAQDFPSQSLRLCAQACG